jgi:hypothetical protein
MQKTIDKIDQLIDLNTTMGRNLAANKLKEIKDEIVGMYSKTDNSESQYIRVGENVTRVTTNTYGHILRGYLVKKEIK